MAEEIVQKFCLAPHPEGGFFRETYRSSSKVLECSDGRRERIASTAIYFLICPGNVSRLHRILSDEVWHFYSGGSMTVVELDDTLETHCRLTKLGSDFAEGEVFQYVVRAGTWFGCYPNPGSSYSFVGCTVAPGFEFTDFELASREKLIREFPAAEEVVRKLTEGLP